MTNALFLLLYMQFSVFSKALFMKIRLILLSLSLCVVGGCAKRADSITPVTIPIAAYSNLDCAQLSQELISESNNAAFLSRKQNEAATGDAIGVFLIGVPTASITGHDREGKLAVSKGKVLSIESAIQAKGCNTPEPSATTVVQ